MVDIGIDTVTDEDIAVHVNLGVDFDVCICIYVHVIHVVAKVQSVYLDPNMCPWHKWMNRYMLRYLKQNLPDVLTLEDNKIQL